jgi:hypothetical protein
MPLFGIQQLMYATENENAKPIDEVFTKQEQQCLRQLNKQFTGLTQVLSNPYNHQSMLWTKWIVARLGCWKVYNSQRRAGPDKYMLKKGLI